jgi:hypothetical protein
LSNWAFFKNSFVVGGGGGASTNRDHTILNLERRQMLVSKRLLWCGVVQVCCIFPLGLHFVRFLKQISGSVQRYIILY